MADNIISLTKRTADKIGELIRDNDAGNDVSQVASPLSGNNIQWVKTDGGTYTYTVSMVSVTLYSGNIVRYDVSSQTWTTLGAVYVYNPDGFSYSANEYVLGYGVGVANSKQVFLAMAGPGSGVSGINIETQDGDIYGPAILPYYVDGTYAAWSSTVTYSAGWIVSSGGHIYKALYTNLNQEPPNTDYWVEVTSPTVLHLPTCVQTVATNHTGVFQHSTRPVIYFALDGLAYPQPGVYYTSGPAINISEDAYAGVLTLSLPDADRNYSGNSVRGLLAAWGVQYFGCFPNVPTFLQVEPVLPGGRGYIACDPFQMMIGFGSAAWGPGAGGSEAWLQIQSGATLGSNVCDLQGFIKVPYRGYSGLGGSGDVQDSGTCYSVNGQHGVYGTMADGSTVTGGIITVIGGGSSITAISGGSF